MLVLPLPKLISDIPSSSLNRSQAVSSRPLAPSKSFTWAFSFDKSPSWQGRPFQCPAMGLLHCSGLVWARSSSETGGQVSTRGLPCETQALLHNQLKFQYDKGGIPQLLSLMASRHWSSLYQHLFSSKCPLGQWSPSPQWRGPQMLE